MALFGGESASPLPTIEKLVTSEDFARAADHFSHKGDLCESDPVKAILYYRRAVDCYRKSNQKLA